MTGESEVLSPVEVEQLIRSLANDIAKGVRAVSAAHGDWKAKQRIYDHAFAVAYLAHVGASHEKRYAAEKLTQQERESAEVAEVAFRHAERQMRSLEIQLSAAQTVSKSIQQMYGASGTGRGN